MCLPQVVESLPSSKRRKNRSRLVFDYDTFIDNHIKPLFRQRFPLVGDRHDYFSLDGVTAFYQFSFKRERVDMFQETESQSVVPFIERPDDPRGGSSEEQFTISHPPA